MLKIMLLTAMFGLIFAHPTLAEEDPMYRVTTVKLDSAKGRHVTTRTTTRHIYTHEGLWFVSYSTGGRGSKAIYRTSRDAVTWSDRKDGGLPYLEDGFGYAYLGEGGPISEGSNIWAFEHWISTAKIEGEALQWGDRVEFFKEPPKQMYFYYIQPRVDSIGRICMTMRHVDRSEGQDTQHPKQTIVWFRSKNPGDLSGWDGPVETIVVPGENTDGHQCIPLEDGMCMVIARTSMKHYDEDGPKGGFYARLFNGEAWEDQYKLDTSDGTGGSDRRLSATFDKKGRTLHLVYTDGEKRLVYRTCKAPYRLSDWSEPDYPMEGKCFTQIIGLDHSVDRARPVIVYGIQRRSDGGRLHVGELFLTRYDGTKWTEPLLVSEEGRDDNWYPSLIEDCSGDIGVLYLRNFYGGKNPEDIEAPWDVMFSKVESISR